MKILSAIKDFKNNLDALTVVLSKYAPHREEINKMLCIFKNSSLIEVNKVDDMIKLYKSHNMIIGASGISLLERISMGIYCLSFALNDNQESKYEEKES